MEGLTEEQLQQIETAKSLLSQNGMVVKSESEFNQALDNKASAVKESFQSEFTSNFHSQFEDGMKERGFEKATNEKGYQLAYRVIDSQKEEIESLKSKSKGSDEKDALLDQVKNEYSSLQQNFEAFKENASSELNNYKKSVVIESASSGLTFKDNIPPALIDSHLSQLKQNLVQSSKITEDGKTVFLDSKGEVMLNKDNNLEPYTAGEILKANLADYIKIGNTKSGAGSMSGGKEIPQGANKIAKTSIDGSKDKNEALNNLYSYARENNIKNGSKDFRDAFTSIQEYYKE